MRCILILSLLALSLCAQELTLAPSGGSNFRFKDALGQAFSNAYVGSYTYSSASVKISLDTTNNSFLSGTVLGSGLKPNFAYQLKVSGRPSKMATTPEELAAADDATNERLGKLGRWWRQTPSPGNSNDADYEANKNKPDYIYQGYLIIGFFVTDETGAVNMAFSGNNSFHVLWRVDQRPPSASDGAGAAYTLTATAGNSAYDVALGARPFTLYGEWEPSRALPGQLQMPAADYRAMLMLTEESFHDTTPLSGNWNAAMSAALNVTLPTSGTPGGGGGSTALPLTIRKVRAGVNLVNRGRDVATVSATLALDSAVDLEGHEISINTLGVTRSVVLKRGRGRTKDTQALVKRDRKNPGTVNVQFTIRKASLIVFNAPATGKADVATAAQLTLGGSRYEGSVSAFFRGNERRVTLKF